MKETLLGLAVLIFTLSATSSAQAQTQTLPPKMIPTSPENSSPTPPIEELLPQPTVVGPPPIDFSTRALRGLSLYSGAIHFSPLSTWLPLKYGLSLGYNYSPDWTIEAEYTTKSYSAGLFGVDFADVIDRRYGLQSRWYSGSNSFNFILGFYKSEFKAELGNAILSRAGAPSETVLGFTSYGPQFGLSNRWQWHQGITFGVDWIVMYIPLMGQSIDDEALMTITNQTDRSDLDKVISSIRNIPQFDLLKLNLGYTF